LFEDKDVTHVMGEIDPTRDAGVIQTELILKDLEILKRNEDKLEKIARSGDKQAKIHADWIARALSQLNQGKTLRQMELSEEEKDYFQNLNLITLKPILYVGNVSEDEVKGPKSDHLKALEEIAHQDNSSMVVISGKIEEEISQLDESEKGEYLQSIGLEESGLDQLVREGYNLLKLITFFTSGPKENRAWTVGAGSTAPQAAGKIHSDFERGFIRAEVIGFNDFVQYQGEVGAKNAGKLRVEGKEYKVVDGDIMHFRFNV